jgi:hypothetical protein
MAVFAAQRDENHLDNEGASQLRSEDGWRSPSNSRPSSGSFSPTGMQRRWIDIVTGWDCFTVKNLTSSQELYVGCSCP